MKIRHFFSIFLLFFAFSAASAQNSSITLDDGSILYLDFYGPGIVRIFHDPSGGPVRDPQPIPPASILVPDAKRPSGEAGLDRLYGFVRNLKISHNGGRTTVCFEDPGDGHFFGGGVQNGRFIHDGNTIAIENQNSWTDGGVSSPAPFIWSSTGYGILWNTFDKGIYSFDGSKVTLTHDTPWLDIFVMVGDRPEDILARYYQLTGAPVLLPRFGFYEGHLNAYNRDYWLEDEGGILFEDGRRYKESQKDNGGVRESLNGELPGNYQFSARAVIDRYEAADMPLGWILPNDGYGAGYGQTETLEGNIDNLRTFGDYARSKGVEIGLWTQSDLHPVDTIPALLQRDIEGEVGVAGVRVLKTDVAWVYRGYSFGLNGIADAAEIMRPHARPFIITLDGWAGTQRYGGIWTGDQTGGQWEYIRFHIPTYIGAGLSGQPNVGSDMDGIFGGRNEFVNIRDFQWKTFTPMELNMDGWGANEKYPQALGARAAEINRRYLKLKSQLMPYTYSIAWEATRGLPMIRAMFLEEPNAYTLSTKTQYQYMYGPWFLVAPIYQDTQADSDGNDIRDNIYLPEGDWIDYFSGDVYKGGRVLCNFPAPLDKLPVFVKRGAIIPMTEPHNNPSQMDLSKRIYEIYPSSETTSFTEYDDDGRTDAYLRGEYATTEISCAPGKKRNSFHISIEPTRGDFNGFQPLKFTQIIVRGINPLKKFKVKAMVGGKKEKALAYTLEDDSIFILLSKADIRTTAIEVDLEGLSLKAEPSVRTCVGSPRPPVLLDPVVGHSSIDLHWMLDKMATSYRIDFDGVTYTNITGGHYLFEGLKPSTEYSFEIRAVNQCNPSKTVKLSVTTSANPLEWAVSGITATCTAPAQGGQGIGNLFDLSADTEMWHTQWYQSAVPFDITADLGAVYTLDRMEYVPRSDAGNGTILRGSVSTSMDGKAWSEPVPFSWERSAASKLLSLGGVQAAYVRVHVDAATGGFGSGRELFFFRVPGTGAFRKGVFNERGEAVESID